MGGGGGRITVGHTPSLQVYFPPEALHKKIKVALQVIPKMSRFGCLLSDNSTVVWPNDSLVQT